MDEIIFYHTLFFPRPNFGLLDSLFSRVEGLKKEMIFDHDLIHKNKGFTNKKYNIEIQQTGH